ncbi:MAG: glycerol-3-phosphate dehydrogenase/oxidase [Saprospiraceae bacterium]|nr:glycerol-3-phosphate dehydrogenase/oxidase [Saprospiraceae bacterium]
MNDSTFSALDRSLWCNKLISEEFDLLVIGGGITGAGIALDAVTRGLKVALVEKNDFAWGTSSRSTKLIHGGLRYLKQLEFGLVHEVGVERAIVYNNAPHVVIPEKMLLPIIEEGSLGKTLSSIGLWVYDRLANVDKDERRKMLDKEVVIGLEPLIRKDVLLGGGLYYEYRTDDARLAIETMKTAVSKGAVALNYLEVTDLIYKSNGYVGGAIVKDHLSGSVLNIKSRRVVNAAGPWVDNIRAKDKEGVIGKRLHLTKGVHIVVPFSKLPIKQSVYFDVEKDNRMCFAIPRGNITYIGTTDTFYDKNINQPIALRQDVEYILDAINYMFPAAKLNVSDIESTWAGLRPLINEEGKSPSELSRRDEIFYSDTGLISIAGGKLTGYRKMAERVLNFVFKTMHTRSTCITKELKLSGGDFEDPEDIHAFIFKVTNEAKQIGLSQELVQALVYKYGKNIDRIINKAYEFQATIKDQEACIYSAEIWYGINYEMVNNLCDFLIRRTGRLYFERPSLEKWYPYVATKMAEFLGWSEEEKQIEIENFEREYQSVMGFRKF